MTSSIKGSDVKAALSRFDIYTPSEFVRDFKAAKTFEEKSKAIGKAALTAGGAAAIGVGVWNVYKRRNKIIAWIRRLTKKGDDVSDIKIEGGLLK